MFSYLRRRISYANVAATLAVLFAMTGGALAASRYVITSTKQIKPSVLAQIRGKSGAPGKDGAQGAQGAAGPSGALGGKGESGANGSNGTNGADGKVGATGPKGATGATGQTGFTKTLPHGATETGMWAILYSPPPGDEFEDHVPISFSIPLASGSANAFFVNAKETEELDDQAKASGNGGCAGTLEAPTAPVGELCVYTEIEELVNAPFVYVAGPGGASGYGAAGAYLDFRVEEGGTAKARGNWAVTAP